MWENLIVVPLALAIDLTIGEYPDKLHPVAWIGYVISFLLKAAPKKGATLQFIYGLFMVVFTIALFSVPLYFLFAYLRDVSPIAYIIVAALLLKSSFSLKALKKYAENVKQLLDSRKMTEARKQTGYLVSRNTEKLTKGQMASAIIEMVSESVTDSVIAPLFFWLILGIPGAIGYRVANTFDSRIGYRGEYEYLGKFAARLDDVLNYIPARIAALLLVLSAFFLRLNPQKAWRYMWRYHRKTSSPNAGWTMSVAAGALNVRLEKDGHYRLGEAEDYPETTSIAESLRLITLACFFGFGISLAVTGVHYAVAA